MDRGMDLCAFCRLSPLEVPAGPGNVRYMKNRARMRVHELYTTYHCPTSELDPALAPRGTHR